MVRITTAGLVALAATCLQPVDAIKKIDFASCFRDTQIPGGNQYFALGQKSSTDSRVAFYCWANAGDTDISVGNVVTYNSGNNAGYFEYEPGDTWRYRHNFGKGVVNNNRKGKGWGIVAKIHIN